MFDVTNQGEFVGYSTPHFALIGATSRLSNENSKIESQQFVLLAIMHLVMTTELSLVCIG